MLLNYEKQILTTKPSLFEADINSQGNEPIIKLKSMVPVWNERNQMYELDLFGTAKITSSKNLILIDASFDQVVKSPESKGWFSFNLFGSGVDQKLESQNEKLKENIYFVQGKRTKNEFNLHFRSPLSDFHAFSISLASMYKKTFA